MSTAAWFKTLLPAFCWLSSWMSFINIPAELFWQVSEEKALAVFAHPQYIMFTHVYSFLWCRSQWFSCYRHSRYIYLFIHCIPDLFWSTFKNRCRSWNLQLFKYTNKMSWITVNSVLSSFRKHSVLLINISSQVPKTSWNISKEF